MSLLYIQQSLFVAEIPLTKGLVALVDADLYPTRAAYRWYADRGYARRTSGGGHKNHFTIHMHREVLRLRGIDIPPGYEPDHRNRNKADNRTDNLRVLPHWANGRNRALQSNNTSGLRGVFWDKSRGMWQVQIWERGKKYFLGRYPTPDEASAAYEEARERMGLIAASQGGVGR